MSLKGGCWLTDLDCSESLLSSTCWSSWNDP